METKVCTKCGVEKDLTEENFRYRKRKGKIEGRRTECSVCLRARSKAHYQSNKGTYIDRANQWKQNNYEKRKDVAMAYYRRNAESIRKKQVIRESADRIRKLKRIYSQRSREKYPEKARARVAVNTAIKSGDLIKPTVCLICGLPAKRMEAHHEDYGKPLNVTWLCAGCHKKLHRRELTHYLNEGHGPSREPASNPTK